MITFGLKIEGLSQLIKDAERVGGELPEMMRREMVQATTMIQNNARRIGPDRFQNRTGNLRRSITKEVTNASRGRVYVQAEYGLPVETGTRPHVILPKKRKMLAFKINGKMVFARKVNHPGSRPYPYMEPAFIEEGPKILDNYAKMGTMIVNKLAGKA